MDTVDAAPRLRWLRAFVAGFLAELVLLVISAGVYMTTPDPLSILTLIIPPVTLPAFIAAGYWSAKPVPSAAVLQGALAGLIAVGIYAVLLIVEWLFVPNSDFSASLSTSYLIAHVLKIVGGAIGGWLLSRKAAQPAA